MAARLHPDIVTAEVVLADGSSGIEAVKAIVAMSNAVPIFVTAFPERLLRSDRPEHSDLITKPFDVEKLKEIIGQLRFYRAGKTPTGERS